MAQVAKTELKKDPLKGGLFVFRNREGHRAKALLWDRTGWLLIYKRLENGVFHFPVANDGMVEVDVEQLRLLLDGIELGLASRRKAGS